MKKSYEQFMKLLKGSLQNKEVDFKDEVVNWQEIFNLSKEHRVIEIVYKSAKQTKSFKEMDDDFTDNWKSTVIQGAFSQNYKANRFLEIYDELKKANIRGIVFKGLILGQLYEIPDERISKNEHIMIRKQDLLICQAILEKNDFERIAIKENYYHEYHYSCNKTGLNIKVYTNLINEDCVDYHYWTEVFKDPFYDCEMEEINGIEVFTPYLDKHFIYIYYSFIKSLLNNIIKVRQLCDIIMFINKNYEYMDWDYIWREICKINIDSLFMNILQIGIDYLGLDENKIKYAKNKENYNLDTDKLLKSILDCGVYGAYYKSNKKLTGADDEYSYSSINDIKNTSEPLKKSHKLLKTDWIKQAIIDLKGKNNNSINEHNIL